MLINKIYFKEGHFKYMKLIRNTLGQQSRKRGFTIVELLIVIVVIAILAAITIVAYSGITARANAAKAQTNAESAQKVAEAYNADLGYYPVSAANLAAGSQSTQMPNGVSFVPGNPTAATELTSLKANPTTTLAYACYPGTGAAGAAATVCPNTTSTTGGRISYYDPSSSSVKYVYLGSASASVAASAYGYPTT